MKLFAKLPGWFMVVTPLGLYEPDWAVVVERGQAGGGERLYLVVETKGGLFGSGLRGGERQKIACGRAHFAGLAGHEALTFEDQVAMTFGGLLASV